MPLVSVIIPTHNRARLVQRAILSVLTQTFRDFDLIVVDDGSGDDTLEALSPYAGRLRVVAQENRGVSAARNAGLAQTDSELVAFLDSDDEWLPEKLERQIALHRHCQQLFICHTEEVWLRDGTEIRQKPFHRKQGGRFFERALERCLISPSSVMMSRALLDRVGWFDEDLPAAEDYDLWLRVTAFHAVDFVPEPLVIKHGGHMDQLSRTTTAIDQYRISAILKILAEPSLSTEYRDAATRELTRKCRIVAAGCHKRGKYPEAEAYLGLARAYEDKPSQPR